MTRLNNKVKGLLFLFLLAGQILNCQIKEHVHRLNAIDNLLTADVKKIISGNIADKQAVFLGEAVHYSGSDFLAKTEFVKYLVTEHGFKDIAFESDFFGLLFSHQKSGLYKFWSVSDQCAGLMAFLKANNVTIWGFDNQMASQYSKAYFKEMLSDFLKTNNIPADEKFLNLADTLVKNGYDSAKILTDEQVSYLKMHNATLLTDKTVLANANWKQLLESFDSTIELYTVKNNRNDKKGVVIRDRQMAKNLDFLLRQNPDKKFVVWLANAHMSKCDYVSMNGITMGAQFRGLNPGSSYHIAFGTIRMPPERSEKSIRKSTQSDKNILHYLPTTATNYFMDAIKMPLEFKSKRFSDARIFNMGKKTDLLNHFDALVFISDGIEVSYQDYNKQSARKAE